MGTILNGAYKDSYVDFANPSTNYGSSTILYIGESGAPRARWAYIGFDKTIVEGLTVTSAILNIYVNNISGTDMYIIDRITGSWAENTITWNNKPTTTATNYALFAPSLGWNTIDITNQFNDESSLIYGCRIEQGSYPDLIDISARDGANSMYIDITYIDPNDSYADSVTGNDAVNSGASCTYPKKTFEAAYNLIDPNGTIHVCNSGADFSGETVTLTKGFSITTNASTGNFYMPQLI